MNHAGTQDIDLLVIIRINFQFSIFNIQLAKNIILGSYLALPIRSYRKMCIRDRTYKITGEGTDYLSANKNDEKEVPERLDWIAFKNQFFSSVFLADADFEKTKLSSKMETQGISTSCRHPFCSHR